MAFRYKRNRRNFVFGERSIFVSRLAAYHKGHKNTPYIIKHHTWWDNFGTLSLKYNLFERFYLEKEPVFEETKSVKSIFEDPISNFIGFLAENGFDVQDSIQWSSAKAVASSYYINRIFDNLGTNILKYAKSDSPVYITADTCGKHFIITVKNELKDIEETVESTGVGVDSIHMMMGKMNGNLSVIKTDTHYISTLAFECYDE